jgi:hypothetical protein
VRSVRGMDTMGSMDHYDPAGHTLRWGWLLTLVLLAQCAGNKRPPTNPQPPDDVGSWSDSDDSMLDGHDDAQDPKAFVPIPMKPVGNPTHIGSGPIVLTDVSEELGLPSADGHAVSFVDFDQDGWPDLVVVAANGVRFLRNMGGTFDDVTDYVYRGDKEARLEVSNTILVDFDNDGDLDIYLASRSVPDTVLFNDGFSRWAPSSESWSVPPSLDVQGVHSADLDSDGWLDLYVVVGRKTGPDVSSFDEGWAGSPNVLLRNQQGNGFDDVTTAWNAVAGSQSESFGAIFADFDRDNDVDVFVVRDFRPDHFFTNINGSLVDQSANAVGSGVTSLMGLAVGDYDGDANLDMYATNASSDFLYRGNGDGSFTNVFNEAVSGGDPTSNATGWGCAFVDLDNDGDQDVVSVSSYEEGDQPGIKKSPPRIGRYTVLENLGKGTLVDQTSEVGLGDAINGWGLATADYDLDGDVDIVVALQAPLDLGIGPPLGTVKHGIRLLRNDSARAAGNQFMYISLRSPEHNRWAVGATIDVFAGALSSTRVVTAGESYLSQHSYVQHFGLGSHTVAEKVHVQWPDGMHTVAHSVPAGYWQFAPFEGHCCHPGQQCAQDWPDCVVLNSSDAYSTL